MCFQQSTSYNRKRLIMAGTVLSVVVFISATAVIAVATRSIEKGCMGELLCLPISQCKDHINPDLIYDCGNHDSPKICCIPKTVDERNLTTASRIAKMDLIPTNCGIAVSEYLAHGTEAFLGQFPWMVILGYKSTNHPFIEKNCGGTIINDRYVLTAAHCANIDKLTLTQATLGEHNLETNPDCEVSDEDEPPFCAPDAVNIPVEKIIMHKEFNKTTRKNDIALLRLAHNITKYTDEIRPVCLPFGLKIDETYFDTRHFTISGWGYESSSSVGGTSVLQYTTIFAWDRNKCNSALKVPYGPIENRQVCGSGRNLTEACRGDSGGPMTYDHVMGTSRRTTQFGIVSFKALDTCGDVDVPTIFTRVDRYLDWILDHIEP